MHRTEDPHYFCSYVSFGQDGQVHTGRTDCCSCAVTCVRWTHVYETASASVLGCWTLSKGAFSRWFWFYIDPLSITRHPIVWFYRASAFVASIKTTFEDFINKRPNKPAEMIAKFFDAKLRTGYVWRRKWVHWYLCEILCRRYTEVCCFLPFWVYSKSV